MKEWISDNWILLVGILVLLPFATKAFKWVLILGSMFILGYLLQPQVSEFLNK